MNLGSKILLVPSIVLLIGAVIGTSTNSVAADDAITVESDKSKVSSDIKTDDKNDCKESGDGDNKVNCQTESTVHIGTSDTTDGPTEGTGTLIVTKIVECTLPPCLFQPDDFTILVTGDVDPGEVNPFLGSATGNEITLGPGSYSVTEPNPPAGVLTTTFSNDCTGSIDPGETKNCLVTNRVPGLPV